ncbi:HNH endonuclease domain-containing protein [Pseudomonas oryzihabitans]|uniref:Uncharacterized protein (TIGR02646 family) n=1 Tax=Pseudomonas oryzihabitans TaxID=47885 RepID=A0AAJ2EVB3_9PSED|nr:HNH endonuclease domain-containing protein [Pseudomonas psychrotolerans]MDR6233578.1 uncharacterized protein (TIGR02646 family) [Pseudomonas psychrotolerans]
MRTLSKGAECPALKLWKRNNRASPQNIHYDNLDSATREAIIQRLIEEQAGLCAYTMKSISHSNGKWQAHIEHILPRTAHADKSVTWSNLVACIPKPGAHCPFGAVQKGAYDPNDADKLFVKPTQGGMSRHFRFRENGEIEGLTPEARDTIDENVLHLNHSELVNDRKAKIQAAIHRRPSAAEALRRAEDLRKKDRNGHLEPYCEAVAQVLEAYANRIAAKGARLAGAARR